MSRVIPSFFYYYFFFNPIRFQSRINQVPNQPVKPDWISKLHSRDKKNIFYKIRLEKGQVDRYRSNRTFPAFHFTSLTPRISRVTFSRHFPSRTFLFLFIYFGTHKKVKKKLWHSWDDATLKASHLSLSPGTPSYVRSNPPVSLLSSHIFAWPSFTRELRPRGKWKRR